MATIISMNTYFQSRMKVLNTSFNELISRNNTRLNLKMAYMTAIRILFSLRLTHR